MAELKNSVAQAQAETLDLGLIGSTLTAESCGEPGPLRPDQLPQASRVDNRAGDIRVVEDEYPVDGATIGGGHKDVSATLDPNGASATSQVVAVLGDLLKLGGGKADASTEVIPGEARIARASVAVDLDIGGFLKLTGLHWEASHRTGRDPNEAAQADASFDIGTASLLGVPIPLESLAAVEATLNQVLGYSGLTIQFPRIERFTEPADVIRMTPLRIVMKDSPAGADCVRPGAQPHPGPAGAAVRPDRRGLLPARGGAARG